MNFASVFTRSAKLFAARLLDYAVPIRRNRMCFVTRANVPLGGNLRIMLDTMAGQSGLEVGFFKEGLLPANTDHYLKAQGVIIFERYSIRALLFLLSSQTVILSHSARDAFITRRKRGRRVVNLWHGVALKRIERLMTNHGSRFQYSRRLALIKRNSKIYDAMLASNTIDRLVNSLAFGVSHSHVYPIGLPRFDYMRTDYVWPEDLAKQRARLTEQLKGKSLVLYAPTFRDSGTTLVKLLTPHDLLDIRVFCAREGLVFGIRPHPYRTHELLGLCDGVNIIDLSAERYPEGALVLNAANALVVDYSSIWVDYLLLHRPIVAFVPDLETYTNRDRGFIYDHAAVFPGPFLRSWKETLAELKSCLRNGIHENRIQKHEFACRLLLPPPSDRPYRERCAELIAGAPVAECVTPFTYTSSYTASQKAQT